MFNVSVCRIALSYTELFDRIGVGIGEAIKVSYFKSGHVTLFKEYT